ncbi:MAG: hypothetical protein AB7P03_12385 [Kofleriaceae bacterium]
MTRSPSWLDRLLHRRLIYLPGLILVAILWLAAMHIERTAVPDGVTGRPSGFWTSPLPATHGAYRWKLVAVGVGLLYYTGLGMLVLVRRASVERQRRE